MTLAARGSALGPALGLCLLSLLAPSLPASATAAPVAAALPTSLPAAPEQAPALPSSTTAPSGCASDALVPGGVTAAHGTYEFVVQHTGDHPCVLAGPVTMTARSGGRTYDLRPAAGSPSTSSMLPVGAAVTVSVRLTRAGCRAADAVDLRFGASSVEFPKVPMTVCRSARVVLEGVRLAVAH